MSMLAPVVRGPAAALLRAALLGTALLGAALLGAAPCAGLPLDDDGGLNLDPTSSEFARCVAGDGRVGVCALYLKCYANQSLAVGGNLYANDIRDAAAPVSNCGHNMWCCTDDAVAAAGGAGGGGPMPQQRRPDAEADCLRSYDEDCPRCVALYRPGGDVSRGQRTPSGLYCAGALVSARVVLTAASCVRTVAEEAIWARVPAAAAPARRYAVVTKIIHEHYNTATHANDFGLLALDDDVRFARGPAGACVWARPPPRADCRVAAFDELERVVTAGVTVHDGECRRRRNISDAACGAGGAGGCAAAPGAPVLCPVAADGQGGRAVAGVVRRRCADGAAELGLLPQHAGWLQRQTARLGVPAARYAL